MCQSSDLLLAVRVGLIGDKGCVPGSADVAGSQFVEEVEVEVVGVFFVVRVHPLAEEEFVAEGFGEDFGGWEEVRVGCWAG